MLSLFFSSAFQKVFGRGKHIQYQVALVLTDGQNLLCDVCKGCGYSRKHKYVLFPLTAVLKDELAYASVYCLAFQTFKNSLTQVSFDPKNFIIGVKT